MELFANETEHYNLTTGNCAADGHCDHYKQLVWASTSEVGCGIKLCQAVTIDPTYPINMLSYAFVCYYNPAGNIGDRKPYRRGAACSKCGQAGTWAMAL